ncbi:glycoside hydrolase family 75 protein [Aspergillus stella-maris]|uniref:glycoside hydrolase family 75 protein n=1 Tax=Aspergillus stella-maris TaxID=1810926 RepID=UPI003CCE1D88
MTRKIGHIFSLALVIFFSALLGVTVAKKVHPSAFSASKDIDVQALLSTSEKVKNVPAHATYPLSIKDFKHKSTIHSDWASFKNGAAYVFKADMDTDCDGLDYKCKGNADGQALTNWGALSAYEVPFIVIPQKFVEANPVAIPGNNVAAVICNKKMFYGILGDTNGNDPQVTGEGSWLLARSCFPKDNLSGSKGHDEADVTYILYTGPEAVLPPSALNKHYITDFKKLRSMGDKLTTSLMGNLGISSGPNKGQHDNNPPPPSSQPPKEDGHDDNNSGNNNENDDQDGTPNPSVGLGPPPSSSSESPNSESDADDDFDSGAGLQRGAAPQFMALCMAVLVLVVT